MSNQGVIYLVGAGPGDPNLITVKGLALIREADAIIGDMRSHVELLPEARPDVEIHDVGCRSAQNKWPKAKVNQLLFDLAHQGKTVVRLWSGDPFIYGRAAQEMAEARQAGINFELVPGVSSAIAAPAYAGVPLTHWEYATSFGVVTGYESKNPNVRPNWTALAGMETLVILMPLDDLPAIVDRLLAAGRAADTPALAVQEGTLPQQKQVLATLGTLVEAVKRHAIKHPAIVVVGAVATLAEEIAWFKDAGQRPLLGKRVLVTRPRHQTFDFMAALRRLGATPVPFPTIEIQPIADTTLLDAAIHQLSRQTGQRLEFGLPQNGNSEAQAPYNWLVLTSANGVSAFWQRLIALGHDNRSLASVKIAAIGPATAAALKQRLIVPDLLPDVYTAEGLLTAFDQIPSITGQRFLLPRADIARKTLPRGLQERGVMVDDLSVYRTVPLEKTAPQEKVPFPPAVDMITFTSASTVQGYVNCLAGRNPIDVLGTNTTQVVCIGPITAAKAKQLGVPVHITAKKFTIDGLLDSLKTLANQ